MGTIKLFFSLCAVAFGIYIGAELIPVYYANYEFAGDVNTEATVNTYNTKSEEEIRDTIFKKAQECGVPLTREQIKVHRTGTTGTGTLSISAPYTVHFDFPGYPLDLHFDPSVNNKSPF